MSSRDLFGLFATVCDHCRATTVPGPKGLPVCTVCERDTCSNCDVPELRADTDTICKDCMIAHHADRHVFEAQGETYPESLYCRICGASETAHQE